MLFLIKRRFGTAAAALAAFVAVGCAARPFVPYPTPLELSLRAVGTGLLAGLGMLGLDGLIYTAAGLLGCKGLREEFARLRQMFRGQSWAAIVAGSLLAGVGEELVFRGLDARVAFLSLSAFAFGLCHHLPRVGWSSTAWAVWQGVLLGGLVAWSGNLAVCMAAHAAHDFAGFAVFRRLKVDE